MQTQVRHEDRLPDNQAHIVMCSTGMLLNYLHADPMLTVATHVILDEVHERNLDSDLALLLLRSLLDKYVTKQMNEGIID